LKNPHHDQIYGHGTKKPEQDQPRTYFPSPSIPGIFKKTSYGLGNLSLIRISCTTYLSNMGVDL